ncbi:MAG: peptidyl-prolyl cis-trans isomerase [bacterium]|nr:peptidyl-prolyl cis-trans isomerase [bacterium]
MEILSRALRAPLLHFFLIGALLLGVQNQKPLSIKPTESLWVSVEQVEQLKKDLIRQTGMLPSKHQVNEAVENFITEEILYRQARSLGLGANDSAIRYRLIQLARFVSEDPDQSDEHLYRQALELGMDQSDLVVRRQMATLMRLFLEKIPTKQAPAIITEAELREYFQKNSHKFQSPEKLSFTQVYFSKDRRGSQAKKDAEKYLRQMKAENKLPSEVASLGDPFLGGHRFTLNTQAAVERSFGPKFATLLPELKLGTWTGPIKSTFGWHLVWLSRRDPPQTLNFEVVRNQVRHGLIRERRTKRFQDALANLRSKYTIHVERDG